jgi:hypothetical protein
VAKHKSDMKQKSELDKAAKGLEKKQTREKKRLERDEKAKTGRREKLQKCFEKYYTSEDASSLIEESELCKLFIENSLTQEKADRFVANEFPNRCRATSKKGKVAEIGWTAARIAKLYA